MIAQRRPRFASILLVLALQACASPATRFHTLDSTPGRAPRRGDAFLGQTLRVDVVHIPASLDRPELVQVGEANDVRLSDRDYWIGPLGDLLRNVLTQDLAARLGRNAVLTPNEPLPEGASRLAVDILAVKSSASETAMEVSWTLRFPGGRGAGDLGPPRLVQRSLRLTTPSRGRGVQGDPEEMSNLIGQLGDAIAMEVNAPS